MIFSLTFFSINLSKLKQNGALMAVREFRSIAVASKPSHLRLELSVNRLDHRDFIHVMTGFPRARQLSGIAHDSTVPGLL